MFVSGDLKSKLASDSFWVALGFGVNAISALVTSMLLTRILDAESVGTYFLAFSLVIMLSGIAQFGLNITVVRFVGGSEKKGELSNLRSMIIKMLMFVVFIGSVIAVFFMTDTARNIFGRFQGGQALAPYITLVGLWIFFMAIRSFLAEVFRGFHDIKEAALYQRILPNVLVVAALIFLYFAQIPTDLYFVLCIPLFANAMLALIAYFSFRTKISPLPENHSASLKKILHSSTPIATGQILQFVVTQTPLWVLGAVLSAESIASYGVAFRLAAIISLPLLVANNVIMPLVAKHHSNDNKQDLTTLIQYAVTITSVLSISLLTIYAIAGEWMLIFLFGAEYGTAYIMLIIIGCGHVINVLSGSPAIILAMAGKERYVFYSSVLAALATFFISIFIIPIYGETGAAVVTAFGLVALNFILVFYSHKVLGYKTYLSISTIKTTLTRLSA